MIKTHSKAHGVYSQFYSHMESISFTVTRSLSVLQSHGIYSQFYSFTILHYGKKTAASPEKELHYVLAKNAGPLVTEETFGRLSCETERTIVFDAVLDNACSDFSGGGFLCSALDKH